MKSIRQMLRQPIKFTFGLLLMTLASAILCVCIGQALAAKTTAQMLDHQFTTVALPAGSAEFDQLSIQVTNVALSEDLQTWLEEVSVSQPDVVSEISRQGILSAWVPELTPMNYTQGPYIADNFSAEKPFWHYQPEPDGLPYSCGMLVITLDEISQPEPKMQSFTIEKPRAIRDFPSVSAYFEWYNSAEKETVTAGYTLSITGTVTQIVSLQEGYRDPTGMIARLTVTVPTLEDLDALALIPGEQYLVYGMDYYDEDWALRSYLADDRHRNPVEIDAFDPAKIHILTEEEQGYYEVSHPSLIPFARYGSVLLYQSQYEQINAISMTLNTQAEPLSYQDIRDKEGTLLEIRVNNQVTYQDSSGETVTLSTEEYNKRYQIPAIAHLESTVTEFLQSPEGEQWIKAIERDSVNNHAFAVLGVDAMGKLADFARGDSRITQGRDFTAEELDSAARVCIIHEALAAANGLQVGDTITLNLYRSDPGLPYQEFRSEKRGILTPTADFYFDTTTIEEVAVYTVVGCYRGQSLWVDVSENEYGFSPNTVFVPKSSVTIELEYPDSILFTTPVIQNGKLEEFRALATRAGFGERFGYYDQGYSTIAANFHNYETLARQVLAVGVSVYLVFLLLFLLLYPGSERKNTMTMRSIGVPYGKRMIHVLMSSMSIVVPASILGCLLGMGLWQNVVEALQATAEAALSLQIETGTLVFISGLQFLFALIMSCATGCLVSTFCGMASRR